MPLKRFLPILVSGSEVENNWDWRKNAVVLGSCPGYLLTLYTKIEAQ